MKPVPSPARSIIVSGLPRSGTSLLMAMLQAGGVPLFADDLRPADASNPRGYFEYEPAKRLSPQSPWLPLTAGKAVKIVIPLVRRLPPDFPADILLLDRDLSEILASQSAMLALRGTPPVDPAILLPAYERELTLTRQTLASFPNARVLPLAHRALLQAPLESARQIAAFLQLPLNSQSMARTIDPALHRQRGEASGTLHLPHSAQKKENPMAPPSGEVPCERRK